MQNEFIIADPLKRPYHEYEGQTQEHPLVYDGTFQSIEEHCLHLMHLRAYSEALSRTAKKIVLDLGCNNGYGSALIAQSATSVVGLDISSNAIADARSRFSAPNLHFSTYEGNELPFQDSSFDAVISFQVIEHIDDTELYLSEIKRVLRPDGFAMITTPNASIRLDPGMKPWNPFHVTEFKAKELRALIERFFPKVEIAGLFAAPNLYRIEFERCQAARESARERIFELKRKHQVRALKVADYWRVLQWKLSQRLRKEKLQAGVNTGGAIPTEEFPYHVNDFYYSTKALHRALDLMAVAHRHA